MSTTIPKNTEDKFNEQVEKVVKMILNEFKEHNRADIYWSSIPSLAVAKEVGMRFKRQGYYAKITYFVEGWKGFQKLSVAKSPMSECNARMVYDVFL